MTLSDLCILYGLGGLASAAAVYHRRREVTSACIALVLWPLWIPFAGLDARTRPVRLRDSGSTEQRIAALLARAVDETAGSPFASLLNAEVAQRMTTEVGRAVDRVAELDAVLAQPEFSRASVPNGGGLTQLTREADPSRSARLHLANIERLGAIRAAQARALAELEQALSALHSQLLVARYAGSTSLEVDAIVSDLWTRVESLGDALDAYALDLGPAQHEARPRVPYARGEAT